MILLNPKKHDRPYQDEASRRLMRQTIAFFETKGRRRIKEDDHDRVWYADFIDRVPTQIRAKVGPCPLESLAPGC